MFNCCYPLKIKLNKHKINILIWAKDIEDYPFIIRFKTKIEVFSVEIKYTYNIEDYPFIIRFKTVINHFIHLLLFHIEDYPFIIRFKTPTVKAAVA